jgi:hypothetical protein
MAAAADLLELDLPTRWGDISLDDLDEAAGRKRGGLRARAVLALLDAAEAERGTHMLEIASRGCRDFLLKLDNIRGPRNRQQHGDLGGRRALSADEVCSLRINVEEVVAAIVNAQRVARVSAESEINLDY